MKTRRQIFLASFLMLVALLFSNGIYSQGAIVESVPAAPAAAQPSPVQSASFRSSPVMFIENAGQWPEAARFQVWGGPVGTMWLAEDAIWITVMEAGAATRQADEWANAERYLSPDERADRTPAHGVNIKLSFVNANPHPRIEPFDRMDTKVSYFLGSDPAQWHPDVPVWGGVRYVDLYPGIDIVVGTVGAPESAKRPFWVLQAKAGADSGMVKVNIEGADSVTIDGWESLLAIRDRTIRLPLLAAGFNYAINEHRVNGRVAAQAIDAQAEEQAAAPTDNPADLLYSTFLGGGAGDEARDLAVDNEGRAYVTGLTCSTDFPTTPGAFDRGENGQCDVVVARLAAYGSTLGFATYVGGAASDLGYGIAIDSSGRAYVTGYTYSSDFPVTASAFDRSFGGGDIDAYAFRLGAAGSTLEYATYIGGSDRDDATSITVGESGNAYLTGRTSSSDFPTTPAAFDPNPSGSSDAFVVQLNTNGSALEYATILGSGHGLDIVTDESGRAYVTGTAFSDFPTTTDAFDRSNNGGNDVFAVRLNPTGSNLEYSTFLGGSGSEASWDGSIAVDASGRAYISGMTTSSDFPTTAGGFDRTLGGATDKFVVRLNTQGSGLDYSTYLGGSGYEGGWLSRINVDTSGRAYLASTTGSSDFPTTIQAYDRSFNGGSHDAFLARLSQQGNALEYATFLGGSAINPDFGTGVAIDGLGRAYIAGSTDSVDFPTTAGVLDGTYNGGGGDAFIAKLAMAVPSDPTATPTPSVTSTSTPTPTRTATRTNTLTPTATPSPPLTSTRTTTPTQTATSAPTGTHTATPTVTVTPSATSCVVAPMIAHSICEFSGIQGKNSWYYGYYVAPFSTQTFREMVQFLGGYDWWVETGRYWTTLYAIGGHPNGNVTSGGRTPVEHWAVRRWISEVDGTVTISGTIAKSDGRGGDGITGRILVDGVEVWARGITGTDTVGTNYEISVMVHIGSTVDFAIAPGPSDVMDSSRFTALIAVAATPTPTSTPTSTPISGHLTPTPPLSTPTATPDFPACTLTVDKTALPNPARIDSHIGVTLRLEGECPSEVGSAVDVTLVIDRSQSMCGLKLNQAQAAGQAFLDNMAFPPDQAAIISFASTAQLHTGLTGNRAQAGNALGNIACGGFSRIDAGLNKAFEEMSGPRRVAGHTPAVLLLTDGHPEGAYADDVRSAARRIRDAGVQLYTIGLGDDADAALLREIATAPDHFYQSPTPDQLEAIYTRLAGELRQVPAANLNLVDVVGPDFEIVPNSFSGAATPQVDGQTLTWTLPRLDGGVSEVRFDVKPKACGTFPVNESAAVSYDDNRGVRRTAPFPVPTVTVEGCTGDLTDVFIRDNDSDDGRIPSSRPWWLSPDIWVRHAQDGGEQHENPQAGQRNFIYARVTNRGATRVRDIDVAFYFGNPSLGLSWPDNWTPLEATAHIDSLAPGQTTVVAIPWDIPNISGHFCLLVRISAADDPIRLNDTAWDNNIGQRNLHIIAYPQPAAGACQLDESGMYSDRIAFDVFNTLAASSLMDFEISASGLPPQAEVRFEPGPLAGRWSSLDGLVVEADGRLRLVRSPARVFGVRLNPYEKRTVFLEVKAPGNSRFTVGLSEIVRGQVVGGNTYQRYLPPCPLALPLILGPRPGCRPGHTFTADADFDQGLLININHKAPNSNQLQLNDKVTPLPFIWIALSGKGTVAKVNTETGVVLGEYLSAPTGRSRNPSRTTVDLNGNVWVGNRDEAAGGKGSIIHIGLIENSQCIDRNGNGVIDTSTGLGDVKAWPNAGGVDNNGGVSTAQDECIIDYLRTNGTNVRTVAVDVRNNVWVGGLGNMVHDLIDGNSKAVLKTIRPACGGYGGLVDANGVLWSASGNIADSKLLRYDPLTDETRCIAVPYGYGLGIDSQGNIWHSQCSANQVKKLNPNGAIVGDYASSGSCPTGLTVTPVDDNAWIANRYSANVTRLSNNGNAIATVPVGGSPTGASVDAAGKVWVTNYDSNNAMRIDPATNRVDLTVPLGAGAAPYNYSDMTGSVVLSSPPQGKWVVIYDSGTAATPWGTVTWNGLEAGGASLSVRVRSAESRIDLGGQPWTTVTNGVPLASTLSGRYLQVEVQFLGTDQGATPVLYDLTVSPRCQ